MIIFIVSILFIIDNDMKVARNNEGNFQHSVSVTVHSFIFSK